MNANPRGVSLLEVILAIAILGGAMAALSNVVMLGADAALDARDRAIAQMLCEQQMAQLMLASTTQPVPVSGMPLPSPDPSTACTLTVETRMAPLNNMLAITTHVSVGPADQSRLPVTVSLSRWMINPSLGLEQLEAEEQAAAQQASGGGTTSSSGGI